MITTTGPAAGTPQPQPSRDGGYARQCLRFWVDEALTADGFRSTFASVMAATPEFRQMRRCCLRPFVTIRRQCGERLPSPGISVPGYQSVTFLPLFAGMERLICDTARRFWLSRTSRWATSALRFASASSDVFQRNGRGCRRRRLIWSPRTRWFHSCATAFAFNCRNTTGKTGRESRWDQSIL